MGDRTQGCEGIDPLKATQQYLLTAAAEYAHLAATENPVPVTLAILGGDSGTAHGFHIRHYRSLIFVPTKFVRR